MKGLLHFCPMPENVLEESVLQVYIARAQKGDTAAFEKIYDRFFPAVFRYVGFRLQPELVEDLVADVFVKVWEKIGSYKRQGGVPFAAWLFRIARYAVIDAYRQQHRIEEMPDDVADPDPLNRADADLRRNDMLRMVRTAVDALPNRYREILTLTYIADLPHDEVARVLHLTEGAVRILKFRALKKLEALLPEEARERA